ncbi:riboflavin kinase [Delitschia confertaspora ATCC 74209]|uniref:Riboflavin kinase n=1 Tax=Delitschia confertaspora ATCC 74209 TaxID=1513339 RepID=A0A9P4JBD3_9PLEO|nr:riboflavin kinase [Delitschia confertaspora ATCC 74209]
MPPPNGPREQIAGPDTPQSPFPLKLRGPVIKGFGRGSKELGIPTANIPIEGLSIGGHSDLESGIYYGWCSLDCSTTSSQSISSTTASSAPPTEQSSNHAVADLESSSTSSNSQIYPTVLSIGFNPFYGNAKRSIEIHILHQFPSDFYGANLSLIILGYIRPEYDYVSKEALVEDIREDIRVAQRSLDRGDYQSWKSDPWLGGEEQNEPEGVVSDGADARVQRMKRGVGQKGGPAMCVMDP